jgi:hypothetical protein
MAHTHDKANRGPLVALATSAALLALALVAFLHSLDWRGAAFPGFFVMPNRVVPSVALGDWSGVADGRPPYQQVVLAVDGTAVASGPDVYRRAATRGPGDAVAYLFARPDGVETRAFSLRRFGDDEYVAIFGAYLFTGLIYLALGTLAGIRWRVAPLYRALAAVGWTGATFSFTGMDLYGPGIFFRLHVLAEALLPAALAHLALVYPRNQLARGGAGVLPLTYGLALAMATVYETFLGQPSAYTPIHNFCQAMAAAPVIALAVDVALAIGQRKVEPQGTNLPVLLGATLVGALVPGMILALSGATGGRVPVNVSAWTGALFPAGVIAAFRLWPPLGSRLMERSALQPASPA